MNDSGTYASDLTIVGDVMLARKVADSLHKLGLEGAALRVSSLLHGHAVVFNLECPLCIQKPASPFKPDGAPNFWGDPSMARWLRSAGFNIVSMANNHIMDCGIKGLCETIDVLREAGLQIVGTGRNLSEAIRPIIVEHQGKHIALLAFGNGQPATKSTPGVAPFRTVALLEGLAQVPDFVDATVVIMHGGLEFVEYPESWTRQFVTEALHAGADLVVGGHSHCLRGVRQYHNGVAIYGLGDFIMDTADPQHLEAHIQRTAVTKLGFPIGNPEICRAGLCVDVYVREKRAIEYSLRPILVDDDFLPRTPNEAEKFDLSAKIQALSAALTDTDSYAMRQLRDIEISYKATYGNGRMWKDWLTLPFRIRPRHLETLWRIITRK